MIEPDKLNILYSPINFLLIKVEQMRIVAKMLAPIITFIISLNPVNLTTPLYEPTAMRLIAAVMIIYGICFSRIENSKSILKLNLIRYAKKNDATIMVMSNNNTSHFEAYFRDILFKNFTNMMQNTYL